MGYPMSWERLILRNQLGGDYVSPHTPRELIAGDLRRLERDQRDARHLARIRPVGLTPNRPRRPRSGDRRRHPLVPGSPGSARSGALGANQPPSRLIAALALAMSAARAPSRCPRSMCSRNHASALHRRFGWPCIRSQHKLEMVTSVRFHSHEHSSRSTDRATVCE